MDSLYYYGYICLTWLIFFSYRAKKKEQREKREAAGQFEDSDTDAEGHADATVDMGGRSWVSWVIVIFAPNKLVRDW